MLSFLRSTVLRALFPSRCLGCGAYDAWLCNNCCGRIPVHQEECPVCRQSSDGFRTHASCRTRCTLEAVGIGASMRDPCIRPLLHRLKYSFLETAAPDVSALMVRALRQMSVSHTAALVPVPLVRKKRLLRGYNQSTLLARAIADATGRRVCEAAYRIRWTPSQTTLSRNERYANVRGAFRADPPAIPDQAAVLIDDVTTTLATLQSVAIALQSAGWGAITGLVAARGDIPDVLQGSSDHIEISIDKPGEKRYD